MSKTEKLFFWQPFFKKPLLFAKFYAIIVAFATLRQNMEAYRSGHNGTDSKSVVPHGTVGSNPTASAKQPQFCLNRIAVIHYCRNNYIIRGFVVDYYNASDATIAILFLLIIPILFISILIAHFIHKKAKEYIVKNSLALKQLALLEEKYFFHSIEEFYTHTKVQKSLASFRKFNYRSEFVSYVKSDLPFFIELVKRANENKKNFELYDNEFCHIYNTQRIDWKSNLKNKIEDELINKKNYPPFVLFL